LGRREGASIFKVRENMQKPCSKNSEYFGDGQIMEEGLKEIKKMQEKVISPHPQQ